MKHALIGLAAISVAMGISVQAAAASTSGSNVNQRTMSIGNYSARVQGLVAKDSGHFTEFLPIYYLQAGLDKNGYQTTWDGSKGAFQITTPPTVTASNLKKVSVQKGEMTFYIDGTPVANAPKPVVATDPASGVKTSYVAIYYLSNVLQQIGFQAAYDGTAGTWQVTPPATVPVHLALTGTPSKRVAAGTQVSFGVTNNGAPVTSGVTWSATGGVIDQNGNFIATAGGTYQVTATYAGQSVTGTVNVYGPPALVKVSAAAPSLVADNRATDTITVTVVDAEGNRVQNYTGTVVLQAADGNLSPATVAIQNGVGTTTLSAGTAAQTDTVSATALNDASGNPYGGSVNFGQVTVRAVAPQPTSLQLSQDASSSSSTSHVLTVTVLDQAGNELKSTSGANATFMLTGPGFFSNGTSMMSQYITDGATLVVYSQVGQSGPITVTGAAPGFGSGSTTLNSTLTP